MFPWRPKACPCDPAAKGWVEQRLAWLAGQFGDSAFTGRPVVLPTAAFFPDRYDDSEASARAMFDRICTYMGADPHRVDLELTADAASMDLVDEQGRALGGAAGTFSLLGGRVSITLDRSDLGDPMALVGTIAHELAHLRLLGEGRLSPRNFDHELVTDLTVVFMGMGIFLANTPRNWPSDMKTWPQTQLNRPEYMSPAMFGYALAHLAWHRGERWPAWARYLAPAPRAELRASLRYLLRTADSTFPPQ